MVKELKTVLDILEILLIMLNSILIVSIIFESEKFVFVPILIISMSVYIGVLYLHGKL